MAGEKNQVPQSNQSNEELIKKIAELQDAFDKANATAAEAAKAQGELAEKNKALLEENEQLKAVNESLQEDLAKLSEKSLQEKVTESQEKKVELSTKTFKVNGKEYGFNYPVMVYKGNRITNEEVLASEELQAELAAANHSMLKAL
jgi:regulator of replication initiation timing